MRSVIVSSRQGMYFTDSAVSGFVKGAAGWMVLFTLSLTLLLIVAGKYGAAKAFSCGVDLEFDVLLTH